MEPYEVIEHTADIGIRARGRDAAELFGHMAQGLFSLIVPPEAVRASQAIEVQAAGEGWERLLVAFLRELLYRFDTEHFLGKEFEVRRIDPNRVEATARGERLDLARHPVEREVKAVTYCDLSVGQGPDGVWTAQVIFDI